MATATAAPTRCTACVPRIETRDARRVDKKCTTSSHRRPIDRRPPRGLVLVYATVSSEDGAASGTDTTSPSPGHFRAGVAVGDCTGPIDGVGMMGYARLGQTTNGLWQRQKARAFVFSEAKEYETGEVTAKYGGPQRESSPINLHTPSNNGLVALVIVDCCMIFPDAKFAALALVRGEIKKKFNLESPFTETNVCVSATHTHAGPGGYAPHSLYNVTLGGAVNQSFHAIVDGIADALVAAYADAFHSSSETGTDMNTRGTPLRVVSLATVSLVGVATNRSLKAFEKNPKHERDLFTNTGNVDETVHLLVVHDADESNSEDAESNVSDVKKPSPIRGAAAWFAVHGTSLPSENRLISGDNKGVASSLVELALGQSFTDPLLRATSKDPLLRASSVDPLLELYQALADSECLQVSDRGLRNAAIVATAKSAAARVMSSRFVSTTHVSQPGGRPVVIAFPQSASGDVSPNVNGAFDENGEACDGSESLFDRKKAVTSCRGKGPVERDKPASCLVTGAAQAAAVVFALQGVTEGVSEVNDATATRSSPSTVTPPSILSGPIKAAMRWVPIGRFGGVEGNTSRSSDSSETTSTTSPPALGYSFCAGTTDGPGQDGFGQGDVVNTETASNRWRFLSYVATGLFGGRFGGVREAAKQAHAPKPVFVSFCGGDGFSGGKDASNTHTEAPNPRPGWVAVDVPVQAFRIGSLIIVSIPAEVTTVAGRRLAKVALGAALEGDGSDEANENKSKSYSNDATYKVIINGLANGYSGYVTTFEEYQAQRYEGASNLFGPNTLGAYEQTVKDLVRELVASGDAVAETDATRVTTLGIKPFPNAYEGQSARPSNGPQAAIPLFDLRWPPWRNFGQCHGKITGGVAKESIDAFDDRENSLAFSKKESGTSRDSRNGLSTNLIVAGGRDESGEVSVAFLTGRPRRCVAPPPNGTYLVVEKKMDDGAWRVVADDDDLSTVVEWRQRGPFGLGNVLTLRWRPPMGTEGVFRLGVAGAALGFKGWLRGSSTLDFFQGVSEPFVVVKDGEMEGGGL